MRKLLIFLIGILLISTISAELIISPNPIEISTKVGTTKSYNITLNNSYDFDILDFTFGNLTNMGFVFPEIEVTKNQSKVITFNVSTSTSIHETLNIPVSFKFPVDLPNEPVIHYINITEIGFSPNYIIARQGDTIIWKNNDDISHQIFSSGFDLTVNVNESTSWVLQTIGEIDYYDPEWYGWSQFEATIEVLNQTSEELAHNPNYDVNWVVNLNSFLNPTNLTIDNSKGSYEIESGKFKKGLLTITNTGEEIAEIIYLSSNSDWISFNKNNINIDVGEEDWIEYTILPAISNTNSTDKTYNFEIIIKASNSEQEIVNISVFIPFKEITGSLEDDLSVAIWYEEYYCPLHPCSLFCNPELPECANINGSYSGEDQMITFNASARDIFDIKKDLAKLKDSELRSGNELKILADKYGVTIPEIMDLLNRSLESQEKTEKREQERWNIIWIIGGGIAIIILAIGIINKFARKEYKKNLTEGAFEYRK